MENHTRRWFDVKSVPQSHIFSLEDRPGTEPIPICKIIPIINLERTETIEDIIRASQDFGFFQVINHGVPVCAIWDAVEALKELFSLPAEEIRKEADEIGYMYMENASVAVKGAHLWRDNIKHQCQPLDKCMQHWPQNPARYRDVMAKYIGEISKLSLFILELISRGLGLEKGYLGGMSQVQFLTASNYPACPDPTLTFGLLPHFDHNLITILFQGNVEGLQVLKDDKWIGVEVVPNAFVVNIGTQLEIISNGKLRSLLHRVVTNKDEGRTTMATFVNPNLDCIIGPANVLVNESNPPRYPYKSFKEFVVNSKAFGPYTDTVTK